jgi:transcriptional regulator with XRE-family HTH domain
MKTITLSQVLDLLKKKQGDRPASDLAEELGIGRSYLSEIYSGKREPGETVLSALGLRREIVYRPL